MKQQILEAKLARIEAIAREALKRPMDARADLLTIIQIAEKEKSLV